MFLHGAPKTFLGLNPILENSHLVTDHQIYYQERVVRLLDYMVREEMLDNLVMTVLMILLGPLGGRRNSSLVIGNNTTLNKPYEIVSSPTSSTFTPIDRVKSNEDIDELHTVDNDTDKADDNDDGELDLMEFLKKGPPM